LLVAAGVQEVLTMAAVAVAVQVGNTVPMRALMDQQTPAVAEEERGNQMEPRTYLTAAAAAALVRL
tara:strand:+ start:325 stop:522 length:198 start_codon:yes stop_codon:yes gene_type:complete